MRNGRKSGEGKEGRERMVYAGPLYSECSAVTSDKVTFEQRFKGKVAEVQGWGGGIF